MLKTCVLNTKLKAFSFPVSPFVFMTFINKQIYISANCNWSSWACRDCQKQATNQTVKARACQLPARVCNEPPRWKQGSCARAQERRETREENRGREGRDVTTGCLGKEVRSVLNAQKTETMANFMKRKEQRRSTFQCFKSFPQLNIQTYKNALTRKKHEREMVRCEKERNGVSVKAAPKR